MLYHLFMLPYFNRVFIDVKKYPMNKPFLYNTFTLPDIILPNMSNPEIFDNNTDINITEMLILLEELSRDIENDKYNCTIRMDDYFYSVL